MAKKKIAGCGCCGSTCGGFCSEGTSPPEDYNLIVPAGTFYSALGEFDCDETQCSDRTGTFPLTKVAYNHQVDCGGTPTYIGLSGAESLPTLCLYISEPFDICSIYVYTSEFDPPTLVTNTYYWVAQLDGDASTATVYFREWCTGFDNYQVWRKEIESPHDCGTDIENIERYAFGDLDPPEGCLIDDTKELTLEIPP